MKLSKIKFSKPNIALVKFPYGRRDLYSIILSVCVLLSCYRVNVLGTLWSMILILAAVMLFVEVIVKNYKFSSLALTFCAFFAISFVSTFLNQELTSSLIRMYLMCVTYILWCDVYCRKHTRIFFSTHVLVVSIICIIQLYFQIVNPEFFGLTDSNNMVNFLVSDNYLGYYLVPFLTLVFVYSKWKNGKINIVPWLLTIICVYSIFLSGAGSCKLGICFFAAMMFVVCLMGRSWLKINVYLIYAVYLVFLIGIVIFSVQDFFADFLMNFLGKSTSLTGRIYIWARIPAYFSKHPLLGYGIGSGGTTSIIKVLASDTYWSGEYWHAHNYFFEILICGGILQMIPYIGVLWLVSKRVSKCRDNMVANIVKFGLLAMFIMYTSEGVILQPPQYLIYFLVYYSPLFANESSAAESVETQKHRRRLRINIRKRHVTQYYKLK